MKKYGLHIGLNNTSYTIDQDDMSTNSCVENSNFYHEFGKNNGFIQDEEPLINDNATSFNILRYFGYLSSIVKAGDFIFISYSGHGFSIKSKAELDLTSEALVLYDRIFLDMEFKRCLSWLNKDVYIFIVTNSCTNGTLFNTKYHTELILNEKNNKIKEEKSNEIDDISYGQCINYLNTIKYYLNDYKVLKNPIIHFASSSDLYTSPDSYEKDKLSEFTNLFKEITESNFEGTYEDFFYLLKDKLKNPEPFLEQNLNSIHHKKFYNSKFLTIPNK